MSVFGQREVTEEAIQCHVCGKWFKALGSHVIRTHGYMRLDDYRREFGLGRAGLVAKDLSSTFRKNADTRELRRYGELNKGKLRILKSGEGREVALQITPDARRRIVAKTKKNIEQNLYIVGNEYQKMAVAASREKQLAKTHCKNGHPYNDENTHRNARDARVCRVCNRAAVARYAAKKKDH